MNDYVVVVRDSNGLKFRTHGPFDKETAQTHADDLPSTLRGINGESVTVTNDVEPFPIGRKP